MEKLIYDCQILIQQNRTLEAQSLAFQHFGNLSQAKEFIESLQKPANNTPNETSEENTQPQIALFEEIIRQIESNTKLNAIKHLKDATGLGLKDAKDLVELIEANISSKDVLANILNQHFNIKLPDATVREGASTQKNPFGTSVPLKTLLDLLHKKQKIEAVKLVKETDGFGLKESKDIVDAIQAQYNL